MSEKQKNILGNELQPCSTDPVTGFFRDGCCNTSDTDFGLHTVCAELTQAFLDYSKSQGNDLMTPQPGYGFPGLKPGDRWCLCAARWEEARAAGCAPPVFLEATNDACLQLLDLTHLQGHAKT